MTHRSEEQREVLRIYREFELKPRNFLPNIDARETARAVATFYRLPGWNICGDTE